MHPAQTLEQRQQIQKDINHIEAKWLNMDDTWVCNHLPVRFPYRQMARHTIRTSLANSRTDQKQTGSSPSVLRDYDGNEGMFCL